jgi:hypothetical protein
MQMPANTSVLRSQVAREEVSQEEPISPELRSGYGVLPGAEFPTALYVSVAGAFAWMFGFSWLAFGLGGGGVGLDLTMVTVLATVFLAIPFAMYHTASTRFPSVPKRMAAFLQSPIDTYTGPMPPGQAWLEVLLIPGALALAATLIGTVYMLGL